MRDNSFYGLPDVRADQAAIGKRAESRSTGQRERDRERDRERERDVEYLLKSPRFLLNNGNSGKNFIGEKSLKYYNRSFTGLSLCTTGGKSAYPKLINNPRISSQQHFSAIHDVPPLVHPSVRSLSCPHASSRAVCPLCPLRSATNMSLIRISNLASPVHTTEANGVHEISMRDALLRNRKKRKEINILIKLKRIATDFYLLGNKKRRKKTMMMKFPFQNEHFWHHFQFLICNVNKPDLKSV